MSDWNKEQGEGERVQRSWRERDEVQAIRDHALLDAARAVDRHLIVIGALEGSSIHSALSGARRAVLDLLGSADADSSCAGKEGT